MFFFVCLFVALLFLNAELKEKFNIKNFADRNPLFIIDINCKNIAFPKEIIEYMYICCFKTMNWTIEEE